MGLEVGESERKERGAGEGSPLRGSIPYTGKEPERNRKGTGKGNPNGPGECSEWLFRVFRNSSKPLCFIGVSSIPVMTAGSWGWEMGSVSFPIRTGKEPERNRKAGKPDGPPKGN